MAADDHDAVNRGWARRAAGEVAGDVAAELAAPLADLRDRLAMLVDRIDRHVAQATGPVPYPWKALQAMRQDLASAYLDTTSLARLAGDLIGAVGVLGQPAVAVDVERHVEAAVSLARHRIGSRTELLIDVGAVPLVMAPLGELVLAMARMIAVCAISADLSDRASLSVRTRAEPSGRDDGDGPPRWVVIAAVDNGGGAAAEAAELTATLAPFAQRLGGSFDGTSQAEQGSVFELRLPAFTPLG